MESSRSGPSPVCSSMIVSVRWPMSPTPPVPSRLLSAADRPLRLSEPTSRYVVPGCASGRAPSGLDVDLVHGAHRPERHGDQEHDPGHQHEQDERGRSRRLRLGLRGGGTDGAGRTSRRAHRRAAPREVSRGARPRRRRPGRSIRGSIRVGSGSRGPAGVARGPGAASEVALAAVQPAVLRSVLAGPGSVSPTLRHGADGTVRHRAPDRRRGACDRSRAPGAWRIRGPHPGRHGRRLGGRPARPPSPAPSPERLFPWRPVLHRLAPRATPARPSGRGPRRPAPPPSARVALMLMTLVLPGSAQLVAGRKRDRPARAAGLAGPAGRRVALLFGLGPGLRLLRLLAGQQHLLPGPGPAGADGAGRRVGLPVRRRLAPGRPAGAAAEAAAGDGRHQRRALLHRRRQRCSSPRTSSACRRTSWARCSPTAPPPTPTTAATTCCCSAATPAPTAGACAPTPSRWPASTPRPARRCSSACRATC